MKTQLDLQVTIVSPGVVRGKARVIQEESDLNLVEEGEIVILPYSHPMYAMAVMKAAGIVCEAGGKLSHICIVSLEMGIPCLTRVLGAMSKIKTGDLLEMDSDQGVIYKYEE
ncbi:MAG: PEP-utilizing enzyme [Ruminiclostridium sp.]